MKTLAKNNEAAIKGSIVLINLETLVVQFELNIEKLVLHGFSPGDRYPIGEAVERKLTRLLADQGVPQSLERGREIANMDRGAFEVAQGSRAQVVGAQVAKAVYGGLRQ